MTLLAQLEASLCSLMVTEEKVFSKSGGQVASEDPSSTDPSLTIVTNDEVSDEILQTADVSREIPSGLPRV